MRLAVKGSTSLFQEPSLSLLTEEEVTLVEPSAVRALSQPKARLPHIRSCEPSPACTWPTPGPHLDRKAKQAAPAQMGSEGKLLPTGRRGRVSVLPPGESAKAGQGAPCWPDCVTFMR